MKDMRTPPRHKMALTHLAQRLGTDNPDSLGARPRNGHVAVATAHPRAERVHGRGPDLAGDPVPDPRLRGLANSDTLSGRTQFAPVEPQSLVRWDRCPSRGRPSTQSQPGHPCLAPGRVLGRSDRDRTRSRARCANTPDMDQMRRSSMAAERTWLAWWRTALAATAGALAVGRFAPELLHVAAWP